MTIHEKLVDFLDKNSISYRIVEHIAEGHSDRIAKIRGNHPHQAMKAIVALAKNTKKDMQYYLVVFPADMRLDLDALKEYLKVKKVIFAPLNKAQEISGCEIGAIPPFTFNPELKLLVDPQIKENTEIVFNAGLLTKSIFMMAEDYCRLLQPEWVNVAVSADAHE
jgi:Ala-tRNA(Pro) deacylase